MPTRALWMAALTLALASPAFADLIELRDGRKISGTMNRQGDAMVIRAEDGQVITVKPADIMKVTLTSTVSPAEAAEAQWTRIAPSLKSADDLQVVIDTLQKFIEQHPESPRAQEARNQVGIYQMLASNNAVKFRGQWMPRAQIEVKLKQWAEAARPALDYYRQGRLKEAIDAARTALAADEQNPDALTIAGLAAYRANTLLPARSFFATLAESDPSSLLAHNNLAVISWQQKLHAEALLHYARALQVSAQNRLLLDNIAEAVNTYPGDRNGAPYKTLMRQYEPAETRAQADMAIKGLQRWGSTWVTREHFERLSKNRNTIQDHMARLDAQFRSTSEALAGIDSQIAQAQADYDNAIGSVNYFNLQIALQQQRGLDITASLAQRELALQAADRAQRNKLAIEGQRSQFAAASQEYAAQAARLKASLDAASPRYTGNQRIMELGEQENPPPPVAVAVPPELPPLPTTIIVNTPPPPPPVILPVPTPIYVPVPIDDGRGGRGGRGGRDGRGGRGGDDPPPTTSRPRSMEVIPT